jgi:hypothetical protein
MSRDDDLPADTEAQDVKHGSSFRGSIAGDHSASAGNPLYAVDTPFIHFDLTSAVKAAESSLGNLKALSDRDIKR